MRLVKELGSVLLKTIGRKQLSKTIYFVFNFYNRIHVQETKGPIFTCKCVPLYFLNVNRQNLENMWHRNRLFTDRIFFKISPRGIDGAKDLYKLKHLSVCKSISSNAHDIFVPLAPSNGKKFQTTGIIWGKHANLCCIMLTFFFFSCEGENAEKFVCIEGSHEM